MKLNVILVLISSLSFLGYGISYFVSPHMKSEFERFKLEKLGLFVIILELIGGIGLLIGLWYHPILIISSLGLALLMLAGIIVRALSKDSIWVSIPAIFFMILNAFIIYQSL
ncbi:MAG: DoxX family protein [Psychroflexus halocasei]|uniref:DoxX family protein n=1 Tax=Psychroflexus sp. S27 TaxID=1982757 RepID=UPI000C2A48D1|nr:DoxX family protein [Psychroflexus sp. S27]PJX28454.1 hypothetical protein CAP47_01055 [Psychroflexus sp. S27]